MSNDKPYVIIAIIMLAVLATWAGDVYKSPKVFTSLVEFFKILSSGLFGLVTGIAWEKLKTKGGEKNG